MGTGDENRWWSDPEERVRVFDVDPETGHYRRFFDIDDLAGVRVEDPEVFELTHDKVLSLLGGRRRRRAAHRPSRRPRRPGRLPRAPARRRRLAASGSRRSCIPARRCATGRSRGPSATSSSTTCRACSSIPAGEAPLTALYDDARRRRALVRGDRAGGAARAGARARSRARCSGCARIHDPGGLEEALARLPVYRTYVRDGVFAPDDRAALEAAGRPDLFDGAPEEFVSRFQQTSPPVTAKGIEDTALLPLPAPAGAQRRRRRSRSLGRVGRRRSTPPTLCARERFPRALLITQTHDTKRSGDARARVGALSAMAAEWEAHVRALVRADRVARRGRRAGRARALPRLPDARRRLADHARAPRGLPREGAARGQAQHELGRPEPRLGGRASSASPSALLTFEPFLEDFEPFVGGGRRSRASARRSASCC